MNITKRPSAHAMMPVATHDEQSEQNFVASLKGFIGSEIEPAQRAILANKIISRIIKDKGTPPTDHIEVRREMEKEPSYQSWAALTRTAQEMMWDSVGDCVDRQITELTERGKVKNPKGSLEITSDFCVPRYVEAFDVHCMPGNYHTVTHNDDLRQGAVYDRAVSIFHMGRNGSAMNDVRGHTVAAHLFERWPDFEPRRILEIGCTVGHSTLPMARYFPQAEIHAIDVGAGVLRYAWARAEHEGVGIRFSQQNAEATRFPDHHFDLVFSSVMLHETSPTALQNIMNECHRIVKPGGVVLHLEVPGLYPTLDMWGRIRGDYEIMFNNEPYWRGALSTDFNEQLRKRGFSDVRSGYQDAVQAAVRGAAPAFREKSRGVHQSWFVVSGLKPNT